MTMLKSLSVGLIAAAVLPVPALAREHRIASRYLVGGHYDSVVPAATWSYGRLCAPAPRVGAFATAPWTNETPCEPTPGY
jgi:hypothetical protein